MRKPAWRKALLVLLAILVVTAFSFSVAVAAGDSGKAPAAANAKGGGGGNGGGGGDGDSSGKPCPPSSHNPGNNPPNCGQAPSEPPPPPPPPDTCNDGLDNDGDGLFDGDDPECQDPNDGVEDGSDVVDGEPTCGDPDGDGVDHSAFDPEADETGLVSSILHGADQALPAPVGGDQGVVTEINCALIAGGLGL